MVARDYLPRCIAVESYRSAVSADGNILVGFPSEDNGIACGDTLATLRGAIYTRQGFVSVEQLMTPRCEAPSSVP
jgi:hypothetical protein